MQDLPDCQPRGTGPAVVRTNWPPAASRRRSLKCFDTRTSGDKRDASRTVGPMVAAVDAIEVSTDGLTPAEVLDRLEELVREKMTSNSVGEHSSLSRWLLASGRIRYPSCRKPLRRSLPNRLWQAFLKIPRPLDGGGRVSYPLPGRAADAADRRRAGDVEPSKQPRSRAHRAVLPAATQLRRPRDVAEIRSAFAGCSIRSTQFPSIAKAPAWLDSKKHFAG